MISFIGLQTQEVDIQPVVKVVLHADTEVLDEVVVTGYGVTKKAAFTGAASVLDAEKIGNRVDPNPIKALEGTVPGLQMNIGSGQPGAPATIYIRGRNSLNSGTQPLYVIDGVAFDNDAVGIRSDEGQTTSPLSTINAQDIESITVLKDATATSIYGARAANGVIVITTKRGQAGKPRINVTAKVGFNQMPSYTDKYKLVDADKNIELATEALLNSYNSYGVVILLLAIIMKVMAGDYLMIKQVRKLSMIIIQEVGCLITVLPANRQIGWMKSPAPDSYSRMLLISAVAEIQRTLLNIMHPLHTIIMSL